MVKGTISHEDTIIVNIYVPNVGILNFIKQTLLDIKAQYEPQHNNGDFSQAWWYTPESQLFRR
jgi:hypothetical protein